MHTGWEKAKLSDNTHQLSDDMWGGGGRFLLAPWLGAEAESEAMVSRFFLWSLRLTETMGGEEYASQLVLKPGPWSCGYFKYCHFLETVSLTLEVSLLFSTLACKQMSLSNNPEPQPHL